MTTKVKMPVTIGATIDLLFTLREQRKQAEAVVNEFKEKESAIEAHLMGNFGRSDLDGAKGKLANAVIKHSTVAEVTDWDAYYAYIGKQKAWDLLQKRPAITALRARWDAGKTVPGVAAKEITTLSITKV